MFLEMCFLSEGLVAGFTNERLLLVVYDTDMFVEEVLGSAFVFALRTRIWLVSVVGMLGEQLSALG